MLEYAVCIIGLGGGLPLVHLCHPYADYPYNSIPSPCVPTQHPLHLTSPSVSPLFISSPFPNTQLPSNFSVSSSFPACFSLSTFSPSPSSICNYFSPPPSVHTFFLSATFGRWSSRRDGRSNLANSGGPL